jgi:ATP/maltotriose-dependent transcriptional regulator MalT/two-component SAPR family response regulator
MWNGMEDRIQVARASGVGLYDYLAQQVLDQQPPMMRDFLLKTALLEEFDIDLCQAVLGEPPGGLRWMDLIQDVLQNNLFVLPVGDKETWLRYHHLFRDFLQDQVFSENRELALFILQRLAKVYTNTKSWEKAYEIYQRIDDQDGVIELIERAGTSMIKNRQLNRLNTWLEQFTPAQIESRPRLLSLQGSLNILFGQVGLGISRLDQAEIKLVESGDRLELALLTVRRSTGHGFLGNYQKALLDVDKALAIVEEDADFQDVYAEALRLKGLGYYRLGDLGRAVEYLKDALKLFQSLSNPLNKAITHGDLGLVYMDSGNLSEALAHNEKAFTYWNRIGNVARMVTVLNNIGVLHHLRGKYTQASKNLNETLILAQKSGNLRIEAYALASIGDLYAELDAFDAAEEAYRLAREISMRINNQRLLIYTDLSIASVHWRNGNADKADEKLKASRNLIHKSDSTYEKGLFELISGQIALERGDGEVAISNLQRAIDHFERGGQDAEAIQAYLSLSRAYFDLSDPNHSFSCLRYALQLGKDSNCMHILLVASRGAEIIFNDKSIPKDLKPQIRQLANQVKELEERIPEFRKVIRQQGLVISIERAPRIRIQALGTSQVWLDGEPVSVPEWRVQKTVRELFFLLLANPDGLSRNDIGLILWPDSSIQQLRVQFKNAMYRLRRALGKGVVEYDSKKDSYRFNWSMDYEYDVEVFWKAIKRAEISPERVKIEAYGEAVKAYQGSYFPDGEALWIYPERERMWQMYLQAELEISRYTLKVGEYHAALAHIHRVLAQDQCQEEAHRLAMMVYAAMGNQADLVRQYEICKQALSGMLGISPSQKTESLYAELLMET